MRFRIGRLLVSPGSTIATLVVVVFVSELLIMLLIEDIFHPPYRPSVSGLFWYFIDPLLLSAIVGLFLYFTMFRPLQEERTRLRAILDTLSEGVALNEIVLDTSGDMVDYRILEVNPAFHHTADFVHPGPIIGQLATKLYGMDADTIRRFWTAAKHSADAMESEMVSPITGKRFSVTASPFFDGKFVTSFRDITKIKQVEEALRRGGDQLRTVFEGAPMGIALIDSVTGVIEEVNPMYARIAGRTIEQMANVSWMSFTHPDDIQKDQDKMTLLNSGEISGFQLEKRYLRPDGSNVLVNLTVAPLPRVDSEPRRHIAMIEDITERRAGEERFRIAFEHNESVMLLLDPESGSIIDANSAAAKFYGYTVESLKAMQIDQINILAPDEIVARQAEAVSRKNNFFVFPHRLASGEIRTVEVRSSPISAGGRTLLFSVIHDVTERKQSEDALYASEARLSAIINGSPIGITVLDATNGRFVEVNDAALRILGYRSDEMLGRTSSELRLFIHPEQRDEGMMTLHTFGSVENLSLDLRRSDGKAINVQYSGRLIDVGGEDLIIGMWTDVTQNIRNEQQLRKLSMAIEQSPESIVITNLDAEIEYVNDAFLKQTGYSTEDVMGMNPRILHSGKTPPETFAAMWETLTRGHSWEGEFQNRRKDGREYIEHAIITPIREPDGSVSHYVAVKEDITDRRRLERTLLERQAELRALYAALQTAREEERRRLARELHDDLGQRVTVMRMDLERIEMALPATLAGIPAKIASVTGQIDALADSIRRLIEDMRPGMLDVLGLVAAVEDYVGKFAARSGVECEFAASQDEIKVSDQVAIGIFRIVQEALNNAQKYAQATRVSVRLLQTVDGIELVIEDNGVGLPEPAEGSRHGFGIQGMNERVAIMNGRFSITSQPSQGVRIEVGIPT